jgi:hypothetical protein
MMKCNIIAQAFTYIDYNKLQSIFVCSMGQLIKSKECPRTKVYDKKDDFRFPIVTFSFFISAASACGECIP